MSRADRLGLLMGHPRRVRWCSHAGHRRARTGKNSRFSVQIGTRQRTQNTGPEWTWGYFCFPHLIWLFFLLQKYSCSIRSSFLTLLTYVFYCSGLKKQPFNLRHVCSFQESPQPWHTADVSDIPELCPEMGWERSECFMEWAKLSKDH